MSHTSFYQGQMKLPDVNPRRRPPYANKILSKSPFALQVDDMVFAKRELHGRPSPKKEEHPFEKFEKVEINGAQEEKSSRMSFSVAGTDI